MHFYLPFTISLCCFSVLHKGTIISECSVEKIKALDKKQAA
jgi:hypothetical protein